MRSKRRENMKKEISNHFSIQFPFVMLLFLIIAVLSSMIIFMGKDVYNGINDDRNANYDIRVSLSYIANKVRQADKNGAIEIRDVEGEPALVIKETYDGSNYNTWIYHYGSSLYELMTDEGSQFEPGDGSEILEVEEFTISKIGDKTYKFTITSKGRNAALVLSLYSGKAVQNEK
jgi:hypothetical protein